VVGKADGRKREVFAVKLEERGEKGIPGPRTVLRHLLRGGRKPEQACAEQACAEQADDVCCGTE